MSTLKIDIDSTFDLDITVQESDKFSELIYVKFERNYRADNVYGCDELFMTASQLDSLGRFLIRQANEIQLSQDSRRQDLLCERN